MKLAHATVHRALQDAHLDGLLSHNPAEHARVPKHDARAVELDYDLQIWTTAQTATFLKRVDGHVMRALWHLAIGTQQTSIKVIRERLDHATIEMTMAVNPHLLPVMDQDAADRSDASLQVRRSPA